MVSVAIVILLAGLVAIYFQCARLQEKRPVTASAGLLLLEDCDDDFRKPPFNDTVTLFCSREDPVRKVSDLNICQTVGGCRAVSVAGRFFTVCENVGNRIGAYELSTGRRLWSLKGETAGDEFTAATVSPNGLVYALSSHGTIYGDQILVIDEEGRIARRASVGGFDLVLDAERGALWLTGKSIKKCDLDLNVLVEVTAVGWCAVSVDVDREGAVWVAERDHPNVAGSTNRLLKLSSSGQILRSIGLSFSPLCVRVDRSDGSVWVTGKAVSKSAGQRFLDSLEKRTGRLPTGKTLRRFLTRPNIHPGTRRFDKNGTLLCEIKQGGFSLDLDPVDGSSWIAGDEKVYHYSRQGKRLARFRAGSWDKYIVVVP